MPQKYVYCFSLDGCPPTFRNKTRLGLLRKIFSSGSHRFFQIFISIFILLTRRKMSEALFKIQNIQTCYFSTCRNEDWPRQKPGQWSVLRVHTCIFLKKLIHVSALYPNKRFSMTKKDE